MMTISKQGEIIARARERRGLSQNALAKAIGKSHAYVWAVEQGRSRMTAAETIEAVAEVLGIDPIELYAGASLIPPDIAASVRALDAEGLGELRDVLAIMRSGSSLRDRLLGRDAISAARTVWIEQEERQSPDVEAIVRAAIEAALGPE